MKGKYTDTFIKRDTERNRERREERAINADKERVEEVLEHYINP